MTEGNHGRGDAVVVACLLTICLSLGGCAGPGDGQQGIVHVALVAVPQDVFCVRMSVQGSRLVQRDFDVTPAVSTVIELSGLPLGAVQVSGAAFAEQCGTPATTETWIADPVSATLKAGMVTPIELTMHRNGRASISVSFQDDATDAGSAGGGGAGGGGAGGNGGGAGGIAGGGGGIDAGVAGAEGSCTVGGGPRPFVSIGGVEQGLSTARDINNLGQVVGKSGERPFLWQDGSARDLGTAGYFVGDAQAINDHSQVAGTVDGLAAIWQDGEVRLLGTPAGWQDFVVAINASGQVLARSTEPNGQQHVVVFDQGGRHEVTPLYGGVAHADTSKRLMNDLGQVVGYINAIPDDGVRAFLWTAGTTIDLGTLGGESAMATAINNAGQIVGGSRNGAGLAGGFLWQAGAMQDLSAQLGLRCITAVDINERGDVLCSGVTDGGASATVWNPSSVQDLIGIKLGVGRINDCGLVAGTTGELYPPVPFMWQSGRVMEVWIPPGESWVYPVGLNNRGDMIVNGISLAYLTSWR